VVSKKQVAFGAARLDLWANRGRASGLWSVARSLVSAQNQVRTWAPPRFGRVRAHRRSSRPLVPLIRQKSRMNGAPADLLFNRRLSPPLDCHPDRASARVEGSAFQAEYLALSP
jgi:hypothetical protein